MFLGLMLACCCCLLQYSTGLTTDLSPGYVLDQEVHNPFNQYIREKSVALMVNIHEGTKQSMGSNDIL